jgi:hypothetical protein
MLTRKIFLLSTMIFLFKVNLFANIIHVPEDKPTIQAAIDVALKSDTVIVSSGTYRENLVFAEKNIVVASLFLITKQDSYIHNTVINPDSGSVVSFVNNNTNSSMLFGFTIKGGTGTKIIHNESKTNYYGAGIFIQNSSPTIQNNIIKQNSTKHTSYGRGGGIAIMGSSNPLIINNTITENSVIGSHAFTEYYGGGIWIDSLACPIIGGCEDYANNIYLNEAVLGVQVFRYGNGEIINAQYNYLGNCPPSWDEVYPTDQFDFSYCLDNPTRIDFLKNITLPNEYNLSQNYPNPFNPSTTIRYYLHKSSYILLKIYNLSGQEIETLVNGFQTKGEYEKTWQPKGLYSGIYFYRLQAGEFSKTEKLILQR